MTHNKLISHNLGGKFLEYFLKKLTFSGRVKTIDEGKTCIHMVYINNKSKFSFSRITGWEQTGTVEDPGIPNSRFSKTKTICTLL